MTTIMQKTYGYTAGGFRAYAANRALRLFPSLWFAVLVSVAVIFAFGVDMSARYPMVLPATFGDWLQNLFLVFVTLHPIHEGPVLLPPTWALVVELVYYAAIGFGLSCNKKITILWLFASLAYFAICLIVDAGRDSTYGSIFGSSLPFALGSAAYHYRECLLKWLDRLWFPILMLFVLRYAILLGNIGIRELYSEDWRFESGLNLLNALCSVGLIVSLFSLRLPDWMRKADKFLGDYSYPVYLLHWPAGAFASFLLYDRVVRGFSVPALLSFSVAMVAIVVLASIAVFVIDRNVYRLRDRVRDRATIGSSDDGSVGVRSG